MPVEEVSNRRGQYKNAGKHEELRRRRQEGSVELRKAKKEEQMMKRRNLNDISDEETDETVPADPKSPEKKGEPKLPLSVCVQYLVKGGATDVQQLKEATTSVRKLLSSSAKNPPIDEIIELGLVPALVKTLQHQDETVQMESAWALTNIVSGTSDQTAQVVDAGAIPVFVQVLKNTNSPQLLEQIIWAVANIAGDGPIYRDQLIKAGIIDILNAFIKLDLSDHQAVLSTMAWTYSNLCRHKLARISLQTAKHMLPSIIWLMNYPNSAVGGDACWALSYLSDITDDYIQEVIDHGGIPALLKLLTSGDKALIAPSLRTLGNIVTGNDCQTQAVLDAGVMTMFANISEESVTPSICKEICWMISNVLAGTKQQIDHVLNAGLGPFLIKQLNQGDFRTQTEAAWAFNNLTMTGEPHHISQVLKMDLMPPLCALLTAKDAKLATLVLDTIENCLKAAESFGQLESVCDLVEECGGLDSIEQLQAHENSDVYKKAAHVIETYFGTDEEQENKENSEPMKFDLGQEDVPAEGFQF